MANKDPLQSSINKLDNTMNALNKTVKGLTKAFTDMNRTETSRKTSPIGGNKKLDDLKNALLKVAPLTKQGTPRKDYERTIEQLIKVNTDSIEKYNKILEFGYNKDNPSNKLKDVYGIKEVQKLVDDILKTLENKKNGISKDDSKHVREDLYGNEKGVSVDSSYKLIQAMDGSSEAVLRTAGVFAQTRSEVVAFQSAIKQATKTVVNNLSGSSKKVNDRLSKMAAGSKILKDVVSNLNHNVTRANRAIEKFTDRLNTASALITSNNRGMRGSVTSINTLVKKIQKTSNTITNIQNSLSKKNSGSSTSAGSSFREQATRNSDRAKQAGFIALLIPALAKLLKKTPITDYFKLLALRFGAGPSGTGEHPVLGAVGLAAAPILSGALLSSVFRRQIMSIGGKLLGVPAASSLKGISKYGMPSVNPFWIPKNMNGAKTLSWLHPLRSLQNLKHLVADRTVAFQRGWNAPNDIWRRNWNKVNYDYHSLVRDANGNIMRWQNPLTGRNVPVTQARTGQIMNAKMYDWGAHMARVFKPISALGKSPFVAGLLKLGGGVLKKLPLIGAALDVGSDIYQGKHAGKSLLSAGAATGVGLATGGWGFLLYPLIKGGIDVITGNLNKQSKQWAQTKKDELGWRNGFGSKVIDVLAGIGEALQPLKSIWDWLVKHFHIKTAGERRQDNLVKDTQNAANKEIKNIEKDKNTFENIKQYQAYLDSGKTDPNFKDSWFGTKKRAYNNMLKKFQDEYASSKANGITRAEAGSMSLYLTNHPGKTSDDWIKDRKTFFKESKSDAAKIASNKAMKNYLNTEEHNLQVRSKNAFDLSQFAGAPSNLVRHDVNHISAVAMADIVGKGKIWSRIVNGKETGNTSPYVAAENAGKLKLLDDLLSAGNHKQLYTSAMGGHKVGTGHYKGNKVDVQTMGEVLSPSEYQKLWDLGYIGQGTGAVGYEFDKSGKITTPKEYKEMFDKGQVNMSNGKHYDLSVSGGISNKAALKSEVVSDLAKNTATTTKEETASSNIRSGLLDIVGAKNKSDKQEKARNIIFSAVDVTGSLGVWGITQLNNGVMRTGR